MRIPIFLVFETNVPCLEFTCGDRLSYISVNLFISYIGTVNKILQFCQFSEHFFHYGTEYALNNK